MGGALSTVRLPGGQLLGREREREALDRVLEAATSGHGGVLVMRGEAVRGLRFARTFGVEAGMELR